MSYSKYETTRTIVDDVVVISMQDVVLKTDSYRQQQQHCHVERTNKSFEINQTAI